MVNLALLYVTAFVVGGIAGSALFYLWPAVTTGEYSVLGRASGKWILNMDYGELKSAMGVAFLIGGLLAMGLVYKFIGRVDP